MDATTVVLALGPGAMLGLLSVGLVLIYRSTGTLNFAQGAMATLGAYLYVFLTDHHVPTVLALALATVLGGVAGVVVEVAVMRPLRGTSVVTRLIATTGVLIVIQSALEVIFGTLTKSAPSTLPTGTVTLPGDIHMGEDRIWLVFIALVITAGLWAVYRYTKFGIATTAVAERPLAAATIGLRVAWVSMGNWFIAGALAALAGALLAPITGLNLELLSGLIVPALAAALVGSLVSFPLALVGAVMIVIAQSVVSLHTDTPGVSTVVPLLAIVVLTVWRGASIPTRGDVSNRLPSIGTGRIRIVPLVIATLVLLGSVYTWLPLVWTRSILASMLVAIVMLSIVVVTGYAGMVSLAQFAFAGFGAYVAATLASDRGWPFWLCAIAGLVAAALLGAILAASSARVRGTNLTVVTLAVSSMLGAFIFSRTQAITIPAPSLLGIDLNAIIYPKRYMVLTCLSFIVLAILVANLRRSGSGRRLLAVRDNEAAAAAIGINPIRVKVAALTFSALVAAVGGILIAYRNPAVVLSDFDVTQSINVLAWTVIGGVGYILGPLLGVGFVPGGVGSQIVDSVVTASVAWISLVGGALLLLTLRSNPDGVASLPRDLRLALKSRLTARATAGDTKAIDRQARAPDRTRGDADAVLNAGPGQEGRGDRARPLELKLSGVTVRFGGVNALSDVSLTVAPGTVHGLIGPNGAGKTTLLDVIGGYVHPSEGTVSLGPDRLDRVPGWRRARMGLGRSFQSAHLFPALNVLETLQVAGDPSRSIGFVRDLVWPGRQRLSEQAREAIDTFELRDLLYANVDTLPHGRRQLVSIAQAMASNPSILLLDEPAAGLSESEREELSTLLRRVARDHGVGVLLIEHDSKLVLAVSDRVTVLAAGAVLASGTPEEIAGSDVVREIYLGAEMNTETTDGKVSMP